MNAIGIDAKTGERCGAADPRDEGSAVGDLSSNAFRPELTLRLVVLLTVSGRYVLNVKSNPYAKNTLHLPFVSKKLTPEVLSQISAARFEGVEIFATRSHF